MNFEKILKVSLFFLIVFSLVLVGCRLTGNYSDNTNSFSTVKGSIQGKISFTAKKNYRISGIRYQELTGLVSAAGAEVWLEDMPDIPHVFTNASGVYSFPDVPVGDHVVIAKLLINNVVQKARSENVSVTADANIVSVPEVQLENASNVLTGVLKDSSGVPLPPGTLLTLWGESFSVGLDGLFTTPPLPDSIDTAEVFVKIPGSQEVTSFVGPFVESGAPAFVEQQILPVADSNHAPSGVLLSKDALGNETIKCKVLDKLYITLTPFDPDANDISLLEFKWNVSNGSLIMGSSGKDAVWTAMENSGVATISVEIKDPKNATSTVNLRLLVDAESIDMVDSAGPVIISKIPDQGATSVDISSKIEVVFDEELQANSITNDSVTVSNAGENISGIVELQPDKKTIIWSGLTSLVSGSEIIATVNGDIRDVNGNPSGKETTWTFQTLGETKVISTNPFFTAAAPTKNITAFVFGGLTPQVDGIIDENSKKIALIVPFGTDVTSLIPSVTHNGINLSPASGIQQDFSTPVNYTVSAYDGSSQVYEVTVIESANPTKSITSFTFESLNPDVSGVVDDVAKTITVNVPYGTSITNIAPTITHSGASISPASGVRRNFTNPVTYTVTATNGTTQEYTVTVTTGGLFDCNISAFNFYGLSPSVIGNINNDDLTITLVVPRGTNLTSLVPTISHNGASISPVSGVARNFTNPVSYTVNARLWLSQTYQVYVVEEPNLNCVINTFDFEGLNPSISGEVDTALRKVVLNVPYGTNVTSLVPTISHTGVSISPASGVPVNFSNPVNYVVTASDGSTQTFQVQVVVSSSTSKDIISFDFEDFDPVVEGDIISFWFRSVSLTVPYGTDVTALTPTIRHSGVSINPPSGTPQNFSNSRTYTVTAANGSTNNYTVTVTVAPNIAKEITSFSFEGLNPPVYGLINDAARVISITVPYGTNITALTPTIVHTGTGISPLSGVAQNFTNTVSYNVVAANGSTKTYNVNVNVEANQAREITSFAFNGLSPSVSGVIDENSKTIELTVPNGTNITNLTPTIVHTGVSMTPVSGASQNFTNPVNYTVTAESNLTKTYSVTVIVEPSSEKDLTSFAFNGLSPAVLGTINQVAKTVSLTVPYDTDLTNLVPTISHTGNSVSPASNVPANFTNPVAYTVTAENGSTQSYQVTVTKEPSPTKSITGFAFNGLDPVVSGSINQGSKKVSVTVPFGTDPSNLVPTITHNGASISPNSGIAQDFTNPVSYTVTAEDSSSQSYEVKVTVAKNPSKKIKQINFSNEVPVVSYNVDDTTGDVDVLVPDGTDITALALNIAHTGKSINPVSGSVQNFTNPVTYTVTAEDDSQKPFMVSAAVDATPQDYISPNIGVLKAINGGVFQRDDNSGNLTEVSTFRMGQYEITQAQYIAVTGAPNPSWCVAPNVLQNNLNRPVEKLTWYDAVEFCNKLSELEGLPLAYTITGRVPASGYPITDAVVTLTGENGYRLPTDAEWQWASMGASDKRKKKFSGSTGSNKIEDYAWFFDNSVDGLLPSDPDYGTHQVGTKLPNELGIYDMNGNVEEWCWDLYDSYPAGQLENPKGAAASSFRLVRGGSWISNMSRTDVSFRRYFYPGVKFDFYGIRVIRQ